MVVCLIVALGCLVCLPCASAAPLIFACSPDNDLLHVVAANGLETKRFDSPDTAIEAASQHAGVLLLADGYPAKTTVLDAELFDKAARKKLRLYVDTRHFCLD